MPTPNSAGLLSYLERESAACEFAQPQLAANSAEELEESTFRVPLEIDGALWSAVVERIAERSVALIVDREAVSALEDDVEGTIHYQPDNATMQRARGHLTTSDLLAGQRVRLNFELM